MPRPPTFALLALALLPLAGCLINAGGDAIVRRSEKRVAVNFESEQGLIDFQQAVRRRGDANGRYLGDSKFAIPFLINVDQRRVLSENAFYNDQVRAADVDGNATLSDAEVRAYAVN